MIQRDGGRSTEAESQEIQALLQELIREVRLLRLALTQGGVAQPLQDIGELLEERPA